MGTRFAMLVLLCAGCWAPTSNISPPPLSPELVEARKARAERLAIRDRWWSEAETAVAEYQATGQRPEVTIEKVSRLEINVSAFSSIPFCLDARQARQRHQSIAFTLADSALAQGDLDTADCVYRRLMAFYSGLIYAGVRDRARLGIADVANRR